MKHGKHIFCFIVLLISGLYSFGQNNLAKAYNSMEKGNADSAKIYINMAMTEVATRKDAQAWYLKGFIYKELYKKYETNNVKSGLRDTAINDMLISYRLDSSKENKENNFPTLKYLAATYCNDAVSIMDSINFHQAMYAFSRYKSVMRKVDRLTNFNTLDVQFYDALGNIYSGYFFNVNDFNVKRKYLDSARKAYDAVLAINPNDFSANYGIGRLYYNQAVNIINNLPIDANIDIVNKAQDTCIHLAKLSLPYMQKAHLLEPLKIEPVKGLQGDYVMLHDQEGFRVNKELEDKLKQQQAPKK